MRKKYRVRVCAWDLNIHYGIYMCTVDTTYHEHRDTLFSPCIVLMYLRFHYSVIGQFLKAILVYLANNINVSQFICPIPNFIK